jgi:GntR family transcriptional regulator
MTTDSLVSRLEAQVRAGGAKTVSQLVVEELWLAVVDGSLESGDRLPTPRQLAIALNVSPRTIERAYEELERRGVTAARPGAGMVVSLRTPSAEDLQKHQQFAQLCRDAVRHAAELGFDVDHLIEALREYRADSQDPPGTEPAS